MAQVYIAEYDSRHYSFTAVGSTQARARQAMRRTLMLWAEQADLEPGWFDLEDLCVFEIDVDDIGTVDRQPMRRAGDT